MTPLYILPFDHRGSFIHDLLGKTYPVKGADKKQFIALKDVIFDGLLYAKARYKGTGALATIIDEESGVNVIKNCRKHGVPFALTTESTSHETFEFVHGNDFRAPFAKLHPTFAKALVYYTVGDEKNNKPMRKRLRELSAFCQKEGIDFMLEVLIQNEGTKADWSGKMIDEIEAAGVKPTIWKIEALETVAEWRELATHTDASIIILGRGESKKQVDTWVKAAANSGCVIGFAVGRTIFLKALKEFVAGKRTRESAVEQIGKNYLHYIRLWEKEAR